MAQGTGTSAPVVNIAGNPAPDGVCAAWLQTADGVRLRATHWPAPAGGNGTVLVLPGRTECIEKYFETCGEILTRGYAVAVLDWRGQGLSARALPDSQKGHVDDFEEYIADLECFVAHAATLGLPRPYTILAHSMGAQIALRYLHDSPGEIARAVLIGPMVHIRTPPALYPIFRALAFCGKSMGFAGTYVFGGRAYSPDSERFEGNLLTGDPARFARIADLSRADPQLALGSPTFGWLDAAYRSMAIVRQADYCAAIKLPVLLLYGSEERVSDPRYQALIGARLPDCEPHMLAGAQHEILQETDQVRAQFWAHFDRFAAAVQPD